MKVAVLSLLRDRLAFTSHCFDALRRNAGCDFDHFVLDQGSRDGTDQWLIQNAGWFKHIEILPENIGIHKGWNKLLDEAGDGYDVYVTFDNDCELFMPGTLAACAQAVLTGEWIVTPTVAGLNQPLSPQEPQDANGIRVGETGVVGGICRAMPGEFIANFRFDENMPPWGGDETHVGQCFDGKLGWLTDWTVNHYLTTEGQKVTLPGYWERKKQEMGIV